MPSLRHSMLACVFSYLLSYGVSFASGQIFNADAIGELADLLMVRMFVIRKPGVTTHLTWPNCILIYVNKLVNMRLRLGRGFFQTAVILQTALQLRDYGYAGWLVGTPSTVYELINEFYYLTWLTFRLTCNTDATLRYDTSMLCYTACSLHA